MFVSRLCSLASSLSVCFQALQSRLKYLSTHTIKLQMEEEEKEKDGQASSEAEQPEAAPQTPLSVVDRAGPPTLATVDAETSLLLEPPPAPTPREMLQPLDITPFVK